MLGLTGSCYIQDRTPALGRTVRPTLHPLTQSISSPLINSDTINNHRDDRLLPFRRFKAPGLTRLPVD